uniref:Uncharacterized protein n=2 Tax=Dendroctonus ponderosae TaxID=77166 RepID=A0AAR5QGI6_DENPD
MEKPSYGLHEHSQEGGYGMSSSWKKILKLLAIFIPIGLLISALTPTVLTVTNVNDTSNVQSSRYRTNDATKRELHSQILSSLDYFDKLNENGCEYRVFCELLLTARQMPNSEQHLILPLALVVTLSWGEEIQKKTAPFHTRTELKVSRSLNPESIQTLNVMTRDGNVAQLIVKRKDRSNPESSAGNLAQSRFVEIGSSNNDQIHQ